MCLVAGRTPLQVAVYNAEHINEQIMNDLLDRSADSVLTKTGVEASPCSMVLFPRYWFSVHMLPRSDNLQLLHYQPKFDGANATCNRSPCIKMACGVLCHAEC